MAGRGDAPSLLPLLLLLLLTRALFGAAALVARCPQGQPAEPRGPGHCQCSEKDVGRSSKTVSIKCDFGNGEDVLLTKDLYPFRNSSLVSAYVRMVNASSVHVSGEFLSEWLQAPSAALDIWRGGNLTLESVPELDNLDTFSTYRTFVGIGIVSCHIPEIPSKFLRDRTRGGFRIKTSRVGTIRAGILHNIKQMRYLVLEDSEVDSVEGPVATEGYVTLSQRNVHSWNGLVLLNTTIKTIGTGAFNLTHQSDMESVDVMKCHIGTLESEALSVAGDIAVSVTNNYFGLLKRTAIKVEVAGDVRFDGNEVERWEVDALEGIVCHNRTSVERNVVHVDVSQELAFNGSLSPFHTSCGLPQVFVVVNPPKPLLLKVKTWESWLVGVLLVVMLAVALLVLFYAKGNTAAAASSSSPSSLRFNTRSNSRQNLPESAEVNLPTDPPLQQGICNPVYGSPTADGSP